MAAVYGISNQLTSISRRPQRSTGADSVVKKTGSISNHVNRQPSPILLLLALSLSFQASFASTIHGHLQSTSGKRISHAVVHIANLGDSVTTDSGEFKVDLPPSYKPGDAVILSVAGWVVLQPYVGSRGRTYLPNAASEEIEVIVAKSGDESLLSTEQIGSIVKESIQSVMSRNASDVSNPPSNANDAFLSQRAQEIGFSVEQLKHAIGQWTRSVESPFEKGLAASYEGRYPEAIRSMSESIQASEEQLAERTMYLGLAYFDNGQYPQAKETLRKANLLDESNTMVLSGLGAALNANEEYEQAVPVLREAARRILASGGGSTLAYSTVANNLGFSYVGLGNYAEAEGCLLRALEIDETIFGPNHPEVATDLSNLGHLYSLTGKYAEAEQLLIRAKQIDLTAHENRDFSLARDLTNLGNVFLKLGKFNQAKECFEEAVTIDKERPNPNHPSVATHLTNLAIVVSESNDFERAEHLLKEARDIDVVALGDSSPETASDLVNLANLYTEEGRADEAIPLLKQALEIDRARLPQKHPNLARDLQALAGAYMQKHNYGAARPLVEEAKGIVQATTGQKSEEFAFVLNAEAEIDRGLHNWEESESEYKAALSILNTWWPNGPDVATVYANMGLMYWQSHRLEDAERAYSMALDICQKDTGPQGAHAIVIEQRLAQLRAEMSQRKEQTVKP
jgi:tetratricopeptide (TPR) repeat protein